jgi:hypothetical protein
MSMFICIACDQYADSDDGCAEAPANYQRHGLICETCIGEGALLDDDGAEPDGRDMSYDGIYRTLTEAGCPDDVAHELAREKSR